MAIRKILVPLDGTESSGIALGTACRLAVDMQCHVVALHVHVRGIEAIPLAGEGLSGAVIEELIDMTERDAAERAKVARSLFNATLTQYGMVATDRASPGTATMALVETDGDEDETVVAYGRVSDLIVVGRPIDVMDPTANATFNAALFETGHPVLVAPSQTPDTIGRRIVVAWNGSVEAARAVTGALSLLAHAEAITIMAVSDSGDHDRLCDPLADQLACHGIVAKSKLMIGHQSAADALLNACAESDLMVMGAYTHSRIRQFILGGVTRHLLENASIPLLMAH